uniref:Exosome complex component CSL4 n=1 Tax=Rhabditophanes sp. KR3021 TaxID=114890 RepID=A0AC35U3A7_9BILA
MQSGLNPSNLDDIKNTFTDRKVVVGEVIIAASNYHKAGPGCYESNGLIRSSLMGLVYTSQEEDTVNKGKYELIFEVRDPNLPSKMCSVARGPAVGDMVTGRVSYISQAYGRVIILCINDLVLKAPLMAIIRKENLGSREAVLETLPQCIQPGDIVSAKILQLATINNPYILEMTEPVFGVIQALGQDGTMEPVIVTEQSHVGEESSVGTESFAEQTVVQHTIASTEEPPRSTVVEQLPAITETVGVPRGKRTAAKRSQDNWKNLIDKKELGEYPEEPEKKVRRTSVTAAKPKPTPGRRGRPPKQMIGCNDLFSEPNKDLYCCSPIQQYEGNSGYPTRPSVNMDKTNVFVYKPLGKYAKASLADTKTFNITPNMKQMTHENVQFSNPQILASMDSILQQHGTKQLTKNSLSEANHFFDSLNNVINDLQMENQKLQINYENEIRTLKFSVHSHEEKIRELVKHVNSLQMERVNSLGELKNLFLRKAASEIVQYEEFVRKETPQQDNTHGIPKFDDPSLTAQQDLQSTEGYMLNNSEAVSDQTNATVQ